MEKRNCPNCGAPYDVQLSKCPYCQTSYFDMSALDLNSHEPFYLKLRFGDMTLTQLVVFDAANVSVETTYDYVDAYDTGRPLCRFISGINSTTIIPFKAIQDKDGSMVKLYKEVK